MDWEVGSSGYAAVWAKDNTRDVALGRDGAPGDLRDDRHAHGRALLRRLRLRRGRRADAKAGRVGYGKGVPMGGDLRKAPAGKAPTFLVAALKDPIGANLDRYQIVKGWLDAKGGRCTRRSTTSCGPATARPDADGKLPAVGSTVDVANATWTNTIGAPELIAVWKDPDFDASAARVLLRARARDPDAALDGIRREALRRQAAARGTRMTLQERAYTSPIWYTPALRRLLREPLLHFAVLGIGLFVLYRAISGNAGAAPNEIVVDAAARRGASDAIRAHAAAGSDRARAPGPRRELCARRGAVSGRARPRPRSR